MEDKKIATIDEYIESCPEEVREKLQNLRHIIKEAAPEVSEKNELANAYLSLFGKCSSFCSI